VEAFLSLFFIMWDILEVDLAIFIVKYVFDLKIMDLIVNWTWDSVINKRQVISFSRLIIGDTYLSLEFICSTFLSYFSWR
jgi:hypothetical protein